MTRTGASPAARVVDAGLGRIGVDDLPGDGAVQHLSERLGGLEPMPLRQRRPPRADLLRPEVDNAALAERGRRLRQQPAQLRDRPRCRLMLRQVLRDQLAERDVTKPPVAAAKPLERDVQGLHCFALTRESADLWPRRATTVEAVAVRPERPAIRAAHLQLEHLSLLRHHRAPLACDLRSQGHRLVCRRRRVSGALPCHDRISIRERVRRAWCSAEDTCAPEVVRSVPPSTETTPPWTLQSMHSRSAPDCPALRRMPSDFTRMRVRGKRPPAVGARGDPSTPAGPQAAVATADVDLGA